MTKIIIEEGGQGQAELIMHQERRNQVTDPEERTYPGLGIGLYISNDIVKRHHGRIRVQSHKGEGATFSVILPLLQEGK